MSLVLPQSETALADPRPPRLSSAYKRHGEAYDEMLDPAGQSREHWRAFLNSFDSLSREELQVRWENAQRIIREHGVTYNIYGDPQGMQRPWHLDMVPLLLAQQEWLHIETGLRQRSQLFQLILEDLYGEQSLVREGIIPPALLFANPRFLRACHRIPPPGGIYIPLHGVDLARSPNGQWWVLADRTQTPSGMGYALENRIVVSRVFRDGFRECQVQRLAAFFRAFRDNLRSMSPRDSANPVIVLLTPGPHNETYFEHAYLARYLGIALVEGGDLTVRNREVYIKNLEGLQRVDVLLRRVDDTFCDPLELRADSFLGVAGLVSAYRAGNVAIANALGSGLIESTAFLPFLPALCRYFLNEELQLPSVATWWCGQEPELEHVLSRLDDLVIKPAFRPSSTVPQFARHLDSLEKAKLAATIRARPYDYVGQEEIPLSMTPVWEKQELVPRPVVVRTFIATGADQAIMPGGLVRVSESIDNPIVSMQSGGGSKDAWVLSNAPVGQESLLTPAGQPISLQPFASDLPSRVADNLFWLGRYVERLEDLVRFLRCLVNRLADESSVEPIAALTGLTELAEQLGIVSQPLHDPADFPLLEKEVVQLIFSETRTGGIKELAGRIRYITSIVRDRFSYDTWSILNQIQSDLRAKPGRLPLSSALTLLNKIVVDLAAFAGMEMENMTRGHGWRFLDCGRRVERGYRLLRLLRAVVANSQRQGALLDPILEIADSTLTYRRRYFSQAQLSGVLDLLIFERKNPRSVAYQAQALQEHATHLPGPPAAHREETGVTFALLDVIDSDACRQMAAQCELSDCAPLERLLEELILGFSSISDRLTQHYFTHTMTQIS